MRLFFVYFFCIENFFFIFNINKIRFKIGSAVEHTLLNRFTNFRNMLFRFKKRRNYNWIIFSRKRFKFFKKSLHLFFFKNIFFKKKNTIFGKLKSIIFFKKKTSMFKRKDRIERAFMRRLNLFKFRKTQLAGFYRKWRKRNFVRTKFVDLHKRTNQIWYINRFIFKKYLYSKKIRQWSVTRTLAGFLNATPREFLSIFENTLQNILIFSKLALSLKEAKFIVESNLVYINGVCCSNYSALANVGDVIQLVLSDRLFRFYRTNFHKKTKFFKRISYSLWLINRFRENFYKQSKNRTPFWINKLLFVYEDVPSFLEVDYITLTICVVFEKTKFHHFNFFNKKFINLFLLRHYNWKYIV